MATYTPPPYFPQGQLSPGDPKRYRKFKLILALVIILALVALGGAAIGIYYLVRSLF